MSDYTWAQLEALWESAGGPVSSAPTAAAIAEAESGGNPDAQNASGATGLWQILGPHNGVNGGQTLSTAQAENPLTNAQAAVTISQQGSDFSPWTTYTGGEYQQYLPGGSSSQGVSTPTDTALSSFPSFAKWAVGFGVVAAVLLYASDNPSWRPLGVAFAVLIAGGVAYKLGPTAWTEVQSLAGTNLSTGASS